MMQFSVVITCCMLVTIASTASLDNCDWTGSGSLQMSLVRGVRPVYLRCHQGTVRWRYPLGALRIVLQPPSAGPTSACIRRTEAASGARIYLASEKRLHTVFRAHDSPDLVRCVRGNPVALYVEADPLGDGLNRETMEFSYQLKRGSKGNKMDDCEPCTEEQLLRHYCTSDFVIQGTVSDLYHNLDLQLSELTVRVTRLHRTHELNELNSTDHVTLHRPLDCGTRWGVTGEYLFLGKWELGNPILTCIPRMSEWKKVRRKAMREGKNECML